MYPSSSFISFSLEKKPSELLHQLVLEWPGVYAEDMPGTARWLFDTSCEVTFVRQKTRMFWFVLCWNRRQSHASKNDESDVCSLLNCELIEHQRRWLLLKQQICSSRTAHPPIHWTLYNVLLWAYTFPILCALVKAKQSYDSQKSNDKHIQVQFCIRTKLNQICVDW